MANQCKSNSRVYLKGAVGALLISLGASEYAIAQLEEVVVTARRKSENLQSVPAAVSNFGKENLQDLGINTVGDIANATPSLVFSTANGTSVNPIVSLRGQVQNDTSVITLDPSVGIYLDEVYLGRSPGSLLDMFDVERVEVLKGPQGTLYGRNTTGGAMKVIPTKASLDGERSGFVRLMFGDHQEMHREAAINIPLHEKVAARLSYSWRDKNGYGNATLVSPEDPSEIVGSFDSGARNSESYRLNAIWDIADALSLEFGYDQSDISTNGAPIYEQDGDKAIVSPAGTITGFERSSTDFYSYYTDIENKGDVYSDGMYLKGVYNSPIGEIKVIGSQRLVDFYFLLDVDGTSARGIIQESRQTVEQDSIEVQLNESFFDDKLDIVLGYFYFEENGRDQFYTYGSEFLAGPLGSPLIPPAFPPGSTAILDQIGDARTSNISESIFAQFSFALLDNVSLTVGGRAVEESKALDMSTSDAGLLNDATGPDMNQVAIAAGMQTNNCPYAPDADGVTNDGEQCRFANTTDYKYNVWTVSSDWSVTDDAMLYLKKSRALRSGGQNFRGRSAETLKPFNPESVVDIELGLKTDLFDNRVRVNIAAYRSAYTDIQFSNVIEVSTFVENLGDATIDGTELELIFAVSDELTISATGTLLNFEYDDETKQGPYAPDKKASVSANYKRPVSWGEFGAALNYAYSGSVPLDNDAEAIKKNPYHSRVPVRMLGVTSYINIASLGLRIGVFGNNLTDEEYIANTIPSFLDADPNTGGITTVGSPRSYGIDFNYDFTL